MLGSGVNFLDQLILAIIRVVLFSWDIHRSELIFMKTLVSIILVVIQSSVSLLQLKNDQGVDLIKCERLLNYHVIIKDLNLLQ